MNRKDEHVELAEAFYHERQTDHYDAIKFVHHSFPTVNQADVSLATSFAGLDFSTPFFINGMTGGSEKTYKINQDLATVARETGLAMASGSVSAGIKHPETAPSFEIIRQTNPNGKVFANLGPEHPLENYLRAVDILKADALQIHVNAPQELVMPEGERVFETWLNNIEKTVQSVGVPVIVKEVGFGMSRQTIMKLQQAGVQTIDVSGNGGTNFLKIENARREHQEFAFAEDWGQSTAISLLEGSTLTNSVELIASGGIRNPYDIVKSLALGAKAAGLSGHFLHLVLNEGVEATIAEVERWKNSIQTMMTLLSAKSVADLTASDVILMDPLKTWCEARQINWQAFANRSK
ncbi:type 2 isopentenyl-diphosphate Delta-isomerase [Vagococcus zengguangii]|uniref:Isopentenyl-diphosphate delta-isomerase n=1 Tax=Vagococcus zengguangii TaxID=2571750 RepID=A0A4D7CXZ0_9ENTE|nr:type 2 isopentenyl-diphosphate Delta-isomerase [Vagococcus zengguangii]QCI87367.1 type 2 isopentenyl-diphosphate Delta-isomerase [Vagococcus zengguangii]TLG81444.1 type 2 isopentenyl-diphosphate Delta-isomerase [Vagococcus zengguangii]